MKGHRVVHPTGPLTVGRQDVLGLAAWAVAAGHHRERDGELDVEELQTLLLGRQRHDLLLEPLVLLLQRVQGFEHFYNCRERKGEGGQGQGREWGTEERGEGDPQEVPQLDHTGGGDWPQITVPPPATPPWHSLVLCPPLGSLACGQNPSWLPHKHAQGPLLPQPVP